MNMTPDENYASAEPLVAKGIAAVPPASPDWDAPTAEVHSLPQPGADERTIKLD